MDGTYTDLIMPAEGRGSGYRFTAFVLLVTVR